MNGGAMPLRGTAHPRPRGHLSSIGSTLYRATEILRHGRDAYPGCRVANTHKLQSRSIVPEGGTLASIIRSDDKLAMAFVVFRIGNVRLAQPGSSSIGGRAVMADGAIFRRPDYRDASAGQAQDLAGLRPLMEATLRERIEQRSQLEIHLEKRRFFEDAIRQSRIPTTRSMIRTSWKRSRFALGDLADRRRDARDNSIGYRPRRP